MAEPSTESAGGRAQKVRTAGDGTGGTGRGKRGGRSVGDPRRPRPASGGGRLLAPLALVICAIAVFAVLTSGDGNGNGNGSTSGGGSESSSSSSRSSRENGGSNSGDSTGSGGGATGPVRATYRVKPGDSFAAIAEKTGVDVDVLSELNPDVDPRALQPGQRLKLK